MAQFCHSVLGQLKEPVDVVVALVGNPNVGKSVIFNQLTGVDVISANYPGTSMEVNAAATRLDGIKVGVLDLPGTYGLGALSEDERVARRCLLEEKPAALVYIVDATNLERNIYMLLQLIELGMPVVIALNLVDEAKRLGFTIDTDKLSRLIGLPVVPTVAIAGTGIDVVLKTAVDMAQGRLKPEPMRVRYGRDIEHAIDGLERVILKELAERPVEMPVRALAIGLLEGDTELQIEVGRGKSVV